MFVNFFLLLFLSFISICSSVALNITQIFQFTRDISAIYETVIQKNGTEVFVTGKNIEGINFIRKYLMAGNTLNIQAQYVGPYLSTYYDYLIVTNSLLISGSKSQGKLRVWDKTTYTYLFQMTTLIYLNKIVLAEVLQRIYYIDRSTKTVKYFNLQNFTASSISMSTYRTADDITISPLNNFMVFMNQLTSTSNMIIKLSTSSFLGYIYSGQIGDKTACWSIDDTFLSIVTQKYVLQVVNTYLEIFNLTSLLLSSTTTTNTGTKTTSGVGGSATQTSFASLYSSYNYSVIGKSSNILYIDRNLQLFVPFYSSTNHSIMSFPVIYPIQARLLQSGLIQTFPFTFISKVLFSYQSEKCFFGLIVDNLIYFYSFYQTCLTNQYFNTSSQACINCSIGCSACTPWLCIDCYPQYYMDYSTNLCVLNQTLVNNSSSSTNTSTNTTTNQSNTTTNQSNTTTNQSNTTTNQSNTSIIIENFTINIPDNNNLTNILNLPYNNSLNTNYTQILLSKNHFFFNLLKQLYFNIIFKIMNKVPASRKVLKPFFKFFINFDDFWLYYYHKRQYNNITLQMFQSIQNFQNQKWQTIKAQYIINKISLSQDKIINQFSYLDPMSQKDNFVQKQNKNSGYLINTMDFYCSNLWLILIVYFLCRVMFWATKNYFISVFFRQYSFTIYLGIMILEGNSQYFTYLIFNQFQMFTNTHYFHKLSHIYSLLTYFTVFMFACLCFIIIFYSFQDKHHKFFFQNTKNTKKGSDYLFGSFFAKNIILGFIHSYFNYNYHIKIFLLIGFQCMFLLINIVMVTKNLVNVHISHWVVICCGFLRVLIIKSFYLDYQMQQNDSHFQQIQQIMFITYLIIGILSLIYQTVSTGLEIGTQIKKNISKSKLIKKYSDGSTECNIPIKSNKSNIIIDKKNHFKRIKFLNNRTEKALKVEQVSWQNSNLIQGQTIQCEKIKKQKKQRIINLDSKISKQSKRIKIKYMALKQKTLGFDHII